jgi:hypothetical protein
VAGLRAGTQYDRRWVSVGEKSLLRSEPLNERYGLFATFEWQAPDFYG